MSAVIDGGSGGGFELAEKAADSSDPDIDTTSHHSHPHRTS
jgi:hypothetical protein